MEIDHLKDITDMQRSHTMEKFFLQDRQCLCSAGTSPQAILIQPIDEHEANTLEQELALLSSPPCPPFLYAAFQVKDWNQELSPWEAPPVFGKESFGHGAPATLGFILDHLLPHLCQRYSLPSDIPVILGGYSLAALFSLWAAYNTDTFTAIAAASPSVWFPGWLDYARQNTLLANSVYMSLGDKEAKSWNPVLASVEQCITEEYQILQEIPAISSTLEWNQGNHFKEPELRTSKAFRWCLKRI